MSAIDRLISELCPDGVEFVELNQLFNMRGGYTPSKSNSSYWDKGTVPWIRMEDIRENGRILDSSLQKISETAVKGGRLFPANSLLVATSATIGEHALVTVPHLSNQRFTSLSLKEEFVGRLEMKFAYYYGFVLDDWCLKHTTTSSFASVDMAGFKKFKFPVPPLLVQQEIVRILDMFTQLEAELEAELEARKLQYEHYKSEAFEFSPEAVQVPLGELVDILQGFAFKSSMYVESGIRIVRISDVQKGTMSDKDLKYYPESAANEIERYKLNAGDLVMSLSGSVGRVAMLSEADLPAALNQRVACIRPNTPRVITRYLFHYLNTNRFEQEAIASTSGGTVKNLSSRWLKEIFIPLPTIEVQKRVVSVLDQFDALVNDLNVGLPAELVARRKQYEYYRDQLLTFKKLSV